jgi:hypothetical protein
MKMLRFTVQLEPKNLSFLPADDGKYAANLVLAAVSMDENQDIKASKIESVTVLSSTQDPNRLPEIASSFGFKIRVPRNTRTVRVVMENQESGRIGAAELSRKTIDAAPASPTPEPAVTDRRPEYANHAP